MSIIGSSILKDTLRNGRCRRVPKQMATCVDKSRPEISRSPPSCDLDRAQLDNSLYTCIKFCRTSYTDAVLCGTINHHHERITDEFDREEEEFWQRICEEARLDAEQEPILQDYYCSTILSHNSLGSALANHLANKLSFTNLPNCVLYEVFLGELVDDLEIRRAVREDLKAVKERDPACISFVHCLLNFKGFLACQAHRVAHKLWSRGRKVLALLIQSRVSEVFAMDIHPGAQIGHGILFDHATGVVIGETAVIGNNVSILHNVTLGGTGKVSGDRHPKIGDGVLVGAGTQILGSVRIGEGAKIGAGSVVLKEVPPRTTAVGNPARLIGGKENPKKLDKPPSLTMDHTSFISDWSDYVI